MPLDDMHSERPLNVILYHILLSNYDDNLIGADLGLELAKLITLILIPT